MEVLSDFPGKTMISSRTRNTLKVVVTIGFGLAMALFMGWRLGENPAGLFCDEAEIGVRARELSRRNISGFTNLLFYRHFSYHLPILPVYSSLPIIFFLGLSDFSIRLVSVVFSLASLIILYFILKRLKVNAILPVLILAFSPLFYHVSRINFGHLPSFFLMLTGYFWYMQSVKQNLWKRAFCGGLLLGFSGYGHGSYTLAAILFLSALVISEIIANRLKIKNYRMVVWAFLGFLLIYLPILWQINSDPIFKLRWREKVGENERFNYEKLIFIVKNYPKYFSYDYLFKKSEIDFSGASVTRHSVRGNGILLKITLPLILIGWVLILIQKSKNKRFFWPFFIYMFLFPFVDLVTTKDGKPPYSFSVFPGLIVIPFITAYGLKVLDYFPQKLTYFVEIILFAIVLIEESFFLNNYQKYPLYSSDYWGWQWGPKEIISYFESVKGNYAELYMTGIFNEPGIFYAFYDPLKKCANCHVGGLDRKKEGIKQLFALRPEELDKEQIVYKTIRSIYYPNGKEAYRFITF